MMWCCWCGCSDTFEYVDEFPINLLHELPERTGHNVTQLIVVVLQYGANVSGPALKGFRQDRHEATAKQGHLSNLLHPVLYYYESLPSGRLYTL